MTLPTDPVGIAIFVIDVLMQGISFDESVSRLSSGISANAAKENRDVTDDEAQLIDGLLAAAERRRRDGV